MRASEPVATMMFFASSVCVPVGLHLHLAAALERGVARDALHLGALEQHLDAFGVLVDDAVLALLDLGVIQARVLAVDALLASALTKRCQTSAVCSRLLVGMQPTSRQVPPSRACFSTSAVFNPYWPARMAAE
jgi:hypothetical protein